jgi:hypothetical protein
MAVQPGSSRSCGEEPHEEAPCHPGPTAEERTAAGGPCNCLPEPPDDWQMCAVCGMSQRPGKPSCGFCGHRLPAGQGGAPTPGT